LSWTIPRTLPVLGVNPVLTLLTAATVLTMFYALCIALDFIQLRRVEQQTEEAEEEYE
jgi:hypothetical protein